MTIKNILSLSLVGAVAMSALPAFAEESASSASTSSERSLTHGQSIKENCAGLTGKERVTCIRDQSKKEDSRPLQKLKNVMKKAVKENCDEYKKGSEEFKSCAKSQKSSARSSVMSTMKEKHPKATKAIKKFIKKRHSEMENGSSSTSSAS